MSHRLSHLALLGAVLLLHCHPCDTAPAPDETTPEPCLCDCPGGPPPAGQISDYCAGDEAQGPCCRGGTPDAPLVGECVAHECVETRGATCHDLQNRGSCAPSVTDLRAACAAQVDAEHPDPILCEDDVMPGGNCLPLVGSMATCGALAGGIYCCGTNP